MTGTDEPATALGWAASGWGSGAGWREAADAALDRLYETGGSPWVTLSPLSSASAGGPPARHGRAVGDDPFEPQASVPHAVGDPITHACDIAMVFVTAGFEADYGRIIEHVGRELGSAHLVGCSATHGIAGGRVLEGRETITILALAAPGISVRSVALSPEVVERAAGLEAFPERQAEYLHRATGVLPGEVHGWILLADHASVEAPSVAALWAAAWPGVGVFGAIASTSGEERTTALFHGADVVPDGVVAVAIGGAWAVETLASQGCAPIGRPWTITEVDGEHAIRRIGRRPALGVLMESVRTLPADLVERARGNLFAGLAVDEVRSTTAGALSDALVSCALLGADQDSGSLLVLGRPAVGQTVQFQYRDAAAASADFELQLAATVARTAGRTPLLAIVLADDARHEAFFGAPDRDAAMVRRATGGAAVAGFGCRAEIGPVGGRVVALTHAACVGLVVPRTGGA